MYFSICYNPSSPQKWNLSDDASGEGDEADDEDAPESRGQVFHGPLSEMTANGTTPPGGSAVRCDGQIGGLKFIWHLQITD